MAASTAPVPGPKRPTESTFTRNLRYEFASEEGRGLVVSYLISGALAAIWLLLVFFGPRMANEGLKLLPTPEPPIMLSVPEDQIPPPTAIAPPAEEATVAPPTTAPATATRVPERGSRTARPGPRGPVTGNPRPGAPGSRTETNRAGAVGTAFGTGSGRGSGGLVGDAGNLLAGVDVGSGSGGTGGGLGGSGGGGEGGKAVLGYGRGGQGSSTPGRGGIGGGSGTGGGGGGGIGGVGGGGGIARAAVRVRAPAVVDAPDVGRARGNVESLGAFVRSRESQLRFCYVEQGLKVNPSLAGSLTTAITLASSGAVSDVDVSSRSWSGAGASDAESCIRNRIRSWRFPSGNEGTYSFSFSFTR